MYSRLQYISQGTTADVQLYHIQRALQGGCDWIQLRWKDAREKELLVLAKAVQALKSSYAFTFIINDHPEVALKADADGVHLGLNDGSIAAARTLLGNEKIIGGTANNLADLQQRIGEACDYIGLGPFRFTNTKAVLSPVLGIEGYHALLEKATENSALPPVYAIGGIRVEDVSLLMKTGIHGIALSGTITQAANPTAIIAQLKTNLYVPTTNR
ncbi:thiamine phosphate synthase [Taibaiella sp. KBW10]|uniref:thiamine phosphate synthase n=1 Tax=Taibaiella sp. KBW10 TaxID=2153357 RepID=UPI000F5A270E|nr:thiamine phosphate synthase [Taibaiella sp. KBW10]RQO30362.1 thiamine phosphate synthase [Taibaiella sp. KBW10]